MKALACEECGYEPMLPKFFDGADCLLCFGCYKAHMNTGAVREFTGDGMLHFAPDTLRYHDGRRLDVIETSEEWQMRTGIYLPDIRIEVVN